MVKIIGSYTYENSISLLLNQYLVISKLSGTWRCIPKREKYALEESFRNSAEPWSGQPLLSGSVTCPFQTTILKHYSTRLFNGVCGVSCFPEKPPNKKQLLKIPASPGSIQWKGKGQNQLGSFLQVGAKRQSGKMIETTTYCSSRLIWQVTLKILGKSYFHHVSPLRKHNFINRCKIEDTSKTRGWWSMSECQDHWTWESKGKSTPGRGQLRNMLGMETPNMKPV